MKGWMIFLIVLGSAILLFLIVSLILNKKQNVIVTKDSEGNLKSTKINQSDLDKIIESDLPTREITLTGQEVQVTLLENATINEEGKVLIELIPSTNGIEDESPEGRLRRKVRKCLDAGGMYDHLADACVHTEGAVGP